MEQNNLLLLALKQIFELSAIPCNKYRFVSAELGFVRSMRGVLEISEQIFAFGQPYRLTEGRVLFMHAGCIRVRANLIELTLKPHQLIVASPGTILQVIEISKDCELEMFAFTNGLMEGWQKKYCCRPFCKEDFMYSLIYRKRKKNGLLPFSIYCGISYTISLSLEIW